MANQSTTTSTTTKSILSSEKFQPCKFAGADPNVIPAVAQTTGLEQCKQVILVKVEQTGYSLLTCVVAIAVLMLGRKLLKKIWGDDDTKEEKKEEKKENK